MYCFKCGKEIPDSSAFCPFCGTRQESVPQAAAGPAAPSPAAADPEPAAVPPRTDYAQPINQSPIRKAQYNLLCILGLVISAISLFFNYFGLVGLGGTIVSVIGLIHCNRKKENGRILGVLGVIFGAFSIIHVILNLM